MSTAVSKLPLTKNFNTKDYNDLKEEVELVDSVLSTLAGYNLNHEHRRWEYAMALRAIASMPHAVETILDVGSGGSPFPFILHTAGYDVSCVDLVERPKSHATWPWQPEWYKADYGFRTYSFDFITSISVIEHINNDDDMLKKWWAVSRLGMFITYDSSSDGGKRAPVHLRSYTVDKMVRKVSVLHDACVFGEIDTTYWGDNVVSGSGCGSFGSVFVVRDNV